MKLYASMMSQTNKYLFSFAMQAAIDGIHSNEMMNLTNNQLFMI
jgi:hypothetical protein